MVAFFKVKNGEIKLESKKIADEKH